MTSIQNSLLALSIAVVCGGCAHPITIAPDLARITPDQTQQKIEKSVGYFISEQNKALRVTTPGGGGDSVEYAPYADLESGLYRVLSNVFGSVHMIKDTKDQAFLDSKNITWVFTPTITTNSSSRNSFFWPPTDFSVTLDCAAANAAKVEVWKTSIKADNDVIAVKEILKEHGLAGKSAATKALSQLQTQLQTAPEFRK
jgi:hypothetical protein